MSSFNPYAVASAFILLVALVAFLAILFRSNRLLCLCLLATLGLHGVGFGYLGFKRYLELLNPPPKEMRVKIAAVKREAPTPPPPTPKKADQPKPIQPAPRLLPAATPKPAPQPLPKPNAALPKGRVDGNPKTKVMPKGTTLKTKTPGKPGPKKPLLAQGPTKPNAGGSEPSKASKILTNGQSDNGIAVDPDAKDFEGSLNGEDAMGAGDFGSGKGKGIGTGIGKGSGEGSEGGGEGGEGAGDPSGTGSGDIPRGFAEGKANGKVYFMRLKHGSGAWNAFSSGTNRLLDFMRTTSFRSENTGRAMTADELKNKYMRKKLPPTFLYLYCDDSFSLSSSEVSTLRDYMAGGGFLFLDSNADPDVRDRIARELNKVLPGTRLSAIANSHPINSFLYKLDAPGIGSNFIEKKNYGISKGGRLIVFYTPGNFSSFYVTAAPSENGYAKAQYQMGANVLVYAMRKGDSSGITKLRGASAKVTTQQLIDLGFLDKPVKTVKPGGPKPSVKVNKPPKPGASPTPAVPDEPDEIKVLDDD